MQATHRQMRDIEGYIVDPADWNPDLAVKLAEEEALELTDEYWQILNFMREYWLDNKVAPDVRHVTEHLVKVYGYDKKAAKKHLFSLFPYGYVKQACKVAGMQRPRAWSTG